MNVLLINGSPREKGCTAAALDIVGKELRDAGIETMQLHVGHLPMAGNVISSGEKSFEGETVERKVLETTALLEACDGLIVGSPVYYALANPTLAAFLHKLFFTSPVDLRMKVGASLVSARRAGTTTALDEINKYFSFHNMPIVSSNYWPMVHGMKPEDIYKDEEGCQILRGLGRNMAFMIKSIALGKATYGLPEAESKILTNFIR